MSLVLLLVLGFFLNSAAALFVLWRGSLDAGGAVVSVVVGTVIFACGGPLFWLLLMAFFVSSTGLGHVRSREKEWLKSIHQKGNRRDLFQVLANGGVGMIAALLYKITSSPAWAVGFAVSFASSNADTWASELGVLSRNGPVSILTFRPTPRGVSGGVSLLGTAVSLAGASFIALIFALENLALNAVPVSLPRLAVIVTAAGFIGSLLDSLLGATIQAQYLISPSQEMPAGAPAISLTERNMSKDGAPNRLVRGLSFVNNDVVNLASCALATTLAVVLTPVLL